MSRPAPYPPDTKAKGWRFEINLEQVIQSDTWALATPDIRPWLLMLWTTAWQQTPCGSLPSEDALIAARLGMAPKVFGKAKAILLRGWWLAEDGRLYHPTITSRVQNMLGIKDKERLRKAEYRARMEAERTEKDSRSRPELSHGTDKGLPRESSVCDDTGTGTGTGTGTSNTNTVDLTRGSGKSESGTEIAQNPRVSHAAAACLAMRAAGIASVSPSNVTLLSLIDLGADVGAFSAAASIAVSKGKDFNYALGIVKSQLTEARVMAQSAANKAVTHSQNPRPMTFKERDDANARKRWEEMTGRTHPDNESPRMFTGNVIDATQKLIGVQK